MEDATLPFLLSKHPDSFVDDPHVEEEDIKPIEGFADFYREFCKEWAKLWSMAGPAIFTLICQFSLGSITQLFAGHIGTAELAAFAVQNSVIARLSFGLMLGMGSALETLCGQAFGAGQVNMLGIYMQRSWIILNATALLLMIFYIFSAPILKFIGQTPEISDAAGQMSIWKIPELFAYALNFPMSKFLQAQGKFFVMAVVAAVAVVLHTYFSWLFMLRLEWGLVGAALVFNVSWMFIVVSQFLYIIGRRSQAWTGFSFKAFHNFWGFLRLSFASAVMLCLELWYMSVLVLFAGHLKDAEMAVDAFSICVNILGWTMMIAFGFNAAISVRVSNELGAEHPRSAKFSVVVVSIISIVMGLLLAGIPIIFRNQYSLLFTNSKQVQQIVYNLSPLLSLSIFINNIQPALSGVAIGAGWQAHVAYVNIGCYYFIGVPLGLIFGYKYNMGVKGIWFGMLSGTALQTFVLFLMIFRTNWNKEASIAGDRIRNWGGKGDTKVDEEHK